MLHVPHQEEIVFPCNIIYNGLLHQVAVLVFVHKNIGIFVAELLCHLFIFENIEGVMLQIIEINDSPFLFLPPVLPVKPGNQITEILHVRIQFIQLFHAAFQTNREKAVTQIFEDCLCLISLLLNRFLQGVLHIPAAPFQIFEFDPRISLAACLKPPVFRQGQQILQLRQIVQKIRLVSHWTAGLSAQRKGTLQQVHGPGKIHTDPGQ